MVATALRASNPLKLEEKHLETLFYMLRDGPIYDGDLVSKTARDDLEEYGMVIRLPHKGRSGFQTVTYAGQDAFCKHHGCHGFGDSTANEAKAIYLESHPNIVPQKPPK